MPLEEGMGLIIDSHTHLGALSGYYNYDVTLDTLLRRMDSLEIQYSISSGTIDLLFGDFDRSYKFALEAFDISKGRILSYYSFNPWGQTHSLKMIDKYNDSKIFKGIKIHPSFHKISGDDERYRTVFEYASVNKLPIISHTWTASLTNPVQKLSVPSKFDKYTAEFPNVKLILAHSGGRYEGILEAITLAQKHPNVYCDVAGDIYANRFVETMVSRIGADRLLYGSDYGMMDQRIMMGVVMGAEISIEDKEKILYQNAIKLFDLDVSTGVS